MKHTGRWILAVAVLAIAGSVCLRILPGDTPATMSKPSAANKRGAMGVSERVTAVPGTGVPRTDAVQALPKQDWVTLFHAAGSNPFDSVARAVQAAYEGDGAAQYYIGRTLGRCEETNALYRDADDPEQAVSHLAYSPAFLEIERQEYLRCRRFRHENAFRSLPTRKEGYPAKYWRSRAVASGYPAAVVAAALDSADSHTPLAIATALATGNPEAMLLFGWTQATANEVTEGTPIMSAAWVLAACDSGADCGPTNDVLPSANCSAGIELGCTERYKLEDELRASLGAEDLEQAHLLARNIQVDMRYHDPAQLRKYLPFWAAN